MLHIPDIQHISVVTLVLPVHHLHTILCQNTQSIQEQCTQTVLWFVDVNLYIDNSCLNCFCYVLEPCELQTHTLLWGCSVNNRIVNREATSLCSLIYRSLFFFCYRSVSSLEPLLQVFGWSLWGNGPYNWIQQGTAEQSKQPTQAAGSAGDRRSPAANTIGKEQERCNRRWSWKTEVENVEI